MIHNLNHTRVIESAFVRLRTQFLRPFMWLVDRNGTTQKPGGGEKEGEPSDRTEGMGSTCHITIQSDYYPSQIIRMGSVKGNP